MAVKKYITNMAKKEIFETICILFWDRLKTKIKAFEKFKTMLLSLKTSANTKVFIGTSLSIRVGQIWPVEITPGKYAGLEFTPNGCWVKVTRGTSNSLSALTHSLERTSSHLKGRGHFLKYLCLVFSPQWAFTGKKGRAGTWPQGCFC